MKNLITGLMILITSTAFAEDKNVTFVNSDKSVTKAELPSKNDKVFDAAIAAKLKQSFKSLSGTEGVGGGDLCEDQIKIIRDDIAKWIQRGGAKDLILPAGVDVAKYSKDMLAQIGKAKIRCVGQGDSDYPVKVFGTPKICRFNNGLLSKTITCDRTAFLALNETQQYVLTHHEYAGLANIERPNQDDSVYNVSNQISAYLVDQVVKRLAVKPAKPTAPPKWQPINGKEAANIARALQDALANTKFADCKVDLEQVIEPPISIQCDGSIYFYNRFNFLSIAQAKLGFMGIPVGSFDCLNSNEEKMNRFLMKSSSGPVAFLNILDKNVYADEREEGLHLRLDSIFELDSTETSIAKVTITKSKVIKINKGTVGNPKWVDEAVGLTTLTCHKSN